MGIEFLKPDDPAAFTGGMDTAAGYNMPKPQAPETAMHTDLTEFSRALSGEYSPFINPVRNIAAAGDWRQANTITRMAYPTDPTYEPFDDMAGYEDHAQWLGQAVSKADMDGRKKVLDAKRGDEEIMATYPGWANFTGAVAAGALDPSMWMTPAILGLVPKAVAASRLGNAVALAKMGAAGAAGSEALMQMSDPERPLSTSVENIGSAAVLSGLLGGVIRGRMTPQEFGEATQELHAMREDIGRSVGSAETAEPVTLHDLTLSGPGDFIARTVGIGTRESSLTSPFVTARKLMAQLTGLTADTNMSREGRTLGPGLFHEAQESQAGAWAVTDATDKAFKAYKLRMKKVGQTSMGKSAFREAVSDALRNGRVHDIPEVTQATKVHAKWLDGPMERADQAGAVDIPRHSERIDRLIAEGAGPKRIAEIMGDASDNSIEEIRAYKEAMMSMYQDHVERISANGLDPLSKAEFFIAVRRVNSGDKSHPYPEVMQAAKVSSTFASKLGLKPEFVAPLGAQSYANRVWNVSKIKADPLAFENHLAKGYLEKGGDPDYVHASAQHSREEIMGSPYHGVDLNRYHVGKVGQFKERVIPLDDNYLKPWLMNDAVDNTRRYLRAVFPQIKMLETFGDLGMKPQFTELRDEAQKMMEQSPARQALRKAASEQIEANPTNSAAISAQLAKAEKALGESAQEKQWGSDILTRLARDEKNLLAVRDEILGRSGVPKDLNDGWVKASSIAMTYNLTRFLGGATLKHVAYIGNLLIRNGMADNAKTLSRFAVDWNAAKMSVSDTRQFGAAVDSKIAHYQGTLADLDAFAETPFTNKMQAASDVFMKLTGLPYALDFLKAAAVTMSQNRSLIAAERLLAGKQISKDTLEMLGRLGISQDDLRVIGQQYAKHGDKTPDLRRARTDLWDEGKDIRDVAERFRAAMRNSATATITTKIPGDMPHMMSKTQFKMLLQFKGFQMASMAHTTIPLAQGLARGDPKAIAGLTTMIGAGFLSYAAAQKVRGKDIEWDKPSTLIGAAAAYSSAMAFLPEAYDLMAHAANTRRDDEHKLPTFLPSYGDSPLRILGGPTASTLEDAYNLATPLFGTKDIDWNKEVHKAGQMTPFMKIWWLRHQTDIAEGKLGDMLNEKFNNPYLTEQERAARRVQ